MRRALTVGAPFLTRFANALSFFDSEPCARSPTSRSPPAALVGENNFIAEIKILGVTQPLPARTAVCSRPAGDCPLKDNSGWRGDESALKTVFCRFGHVGTSELPKYCSKSTQDTSQTLVGYV